MSNLLRSQFFKIKRSKSFYIMILVTIFAATMCLTALISQKDLAADMTGASTMVYGCGGDVCCMMVGILAAFLLCSDFTSGSIKQIIGKGVNRNKYTLASILSVGVVGTGLLILLATLSFAMGYFYTGKVGAINGATFLYFVVGLIICALNYTSYICLITMRFRKISISLIFAILSPSLLDILSRLFGSLVNHGEPATVISLNTHVYRMISMDTAFADRMFSYGVMGCMTFFMAGLALYLFKKKDI